MVVPVTGTGTQTVTIPGLRPGDYTVTLVAVTSTQTLTVAAPAADASVTKSTKAITKKVKTTKVKSSKKH